MIVSTVGRRGQITLPRAVRQHLKLQEGDRIIFARRGDDIVLQPLHCTLSDLRGSVQCSEEQDFNAIRQQMIEAQAHKVAHHEA